MDGSVVRTFAALQEDPSSVLSIHMGQLIATQLQLQGTQHPLVPSGWRVRAHPPPHARTHAHTHMHTHTTHTHHTVMMSLKQCRNCLTVHSFSFGLYFVMALFPGEFRGFAYM